MPIVRNGYAVVRLTVVIELENIKLEVREMSGQEQEDIIVQAINKKYPGLVNLDTLRPDEVDEASEIDIIELDYSDNR